MQKRQDKTAKEAKSTSRKQQDGGEPRSLIERKYQTGLIQGSELPDRIGLEIPRVQATRTHFEFFEGDTHTDIVMISVEAARRLAEKGETARSVFGDSMVIVSTTIADEVLEEWYPGREIWLIDAFQPDFYVPCDRPVYRSDRPAKRRETIDRYLRDVEDVVNATRHDPVEHIPLIKGVLPRERKRCYRQFEELGFDRMAYYCAQYFLYGYRGGELVRDIRVMTSEADLEGLLLIGLQAQSLLRELPPEVTAAAGTNWRGESSFRDEDVGLAEARRNYRDWSEQVEATLEGGQTRLGQFGTATNRGGLAYGN